MDMAASLRALRWRTGLVIVAAALGALWLWARGGPGYLIQVDYSFTGDFLDGAEVFINGELAGTLERYGGKGQRVTGFEVEAGEYEVLVQTDRCEGDPKTVTLSPTETRFVLLLADMDDGYRCKITLR